MKVAFRADASYKIGTGHVIRCLTLAEELRRKNVDCTFICRDHVGNTTDRIIKQKFQVLRLSNAEEFQATSCNDVAHAAWLGCDWEMDAAQTKKCLEEIQPDWLIADHYALDYRWEQYLSNNYKRLMAVSYTHLTLPTICSV